MPRSKHQNGARKGSVKSRQRSDMVFASHAIPTLTAERAAWLVKLLHAGLPAANAVAYILPDAPNQDAIAKVWMNDPLLLQATVTFMKGPWEELEPDQRLVLARDKFLAENAYFLYTHTLESLAADDQIGQAKYAYDTICAYLKGSEAVDDPVKAFLSEMEKKFRPAAGTPAEPDEPTPDHPDYEPHSTH